MLYVCYYRNDRQNRSVTKQISMITFSQEPREIVQFLREKCNSET